MRRNDAFVAKIVITRLTKGFMAMFAPAESLPSPATLVRVNCWMEYVQKILTEIGFLVCVLRFEGIALVYEALTANLK